MIITVGNYVSYNLLPILQSFPNVRRMWLVECVKKLRVLGQRGSTDEIEQLWISRPSRSDSSDHFQLMFVEDFFLEQDV